jgi:uncharacterized protein
MANTEEKIPDGEKASPEEVQNNAALSRRAVPKTRAELLKEVALTGNPLAWALMKMREGHYEFAPHYAPEGCDKGAVLQSPSAYELRKYKVKDLHLETGETVTAWYKPAEKNFPTIVYCHGNAGSLDSRAAILREFSDRGFGVMIAAYPGFKGHYPRPGIEPSERACNATGYAMVRYLMNTKKIPMEKMVLFGESLGGAVALHTAHLLEKGDAELGFDPFKVPAVVCFATFTSLVRRAKEQFPMLPASVLMDNRFESDKIIGKINAPILLMHGRADEYTSPQHSIDLRKASGNKASLALLDGVTHAATYCGTERKDMEQVKLLIDCAQQYVSELGLCPPPQRNPMQSGRITLASSCGKAEPVAEAWQHRVHSPGLNGPGLNGKGFCPDTY